MRLGDWPGAVDGWSGVVPVGDGDLDGDGDGIPDTVVAARADGGAWVFTDTDADGIADQLLDVAPAPGSGSDDDGPLAVLLRWVTG